MPRARLRNRTLLQLLPLGLHRLLSTLPASFAVPPQARPGVPRQHPGGRGPSHARNDVIYGGALGPTRAGGG